MEDEKPQEELPGIPNEHVHIWDILDSQLPQSPIHHPRIGATVVTLVLVRCKTCNLPQTVELEGRWLLQDILKNFPKDDGDGG